jgi:hypothetical protein
MHSGNSEGDLGSVSLSALLFLLLFTGVLIAASSSLLVALSYERRHQDLYETLERLEEIADQIASELARDPTPQSDSLIDPVWDLVREFEGEVTLEDISSRINPNYVDILLFERTDLDRMFVPGASPTEFKEARGGARELHLDIEDAYGSFFPAEAFESVLTAHSYANFNVGDEAQLELLALVRTGDPTVSTSLRGIIQDFRRELRLADRDALREALGLSFDSVYPVVTTDAQMNVHFLAPEILAGVLSYPYQGEPLTDPIGKAERIIMARELDEIDTDELNGIVQANERQMRVFEYLGTTTWFWKIKASAGEVSHEVILARIPDFDRLEETPPVLRVISRRDRY